MGLVLLLDAMYTIDGAVRPASFAEIREVLLWGPERDIHKEVEDGILLPPLPQESNVEGESWGESMNLIQPVTKPHSAVGQKFRIPLTKVLVSADFTSEQDGDEASPMPYVDSSQFRRSNSEAESTPLETVPVTKKFTGKTAVSDGLKTQTKKVSKTEKLTESRKKHEFHQSTTTEDTLSKGEHEMPSTNPPVWSHALISDQLSDPFGRLPSNEEYDRSSRYVHSILYGFNVGF